MIINEDFNNSLVEAYTNKNFIVFNKLMSSIALHDLEVSAFEAIKTNNVEELRILLKDNVNHKIGVSPDAYDLSGMSLLSYAAKFGNLEIVDVLINAGADIYGKEIDVTPPKKDSVDDFDWLSDFDDDLPESYSASKVVGEDGLQKEPSFLLSTPVMQSRDTPLMVSVNNNQLAVAKRLIESYKKNKRDLVNFIESSFGNTSLMLAARRGDKYMVDLLLMHGAIVNVQRKDGMSAIMLAANEATEDNRAYIGVVKRLLKHDADLNFVDNYGNTIFDLVDEKTQPEIYMMLSRTVENNKKNNLIGKFRKIISSVKINLGGSHTKSSVYFNNLK